ncbi:MAG: symmetrical bis(5'-nucleosyl)-tetraphosphatase [Gammaproteobacteria bacterium]|nr:symmetrical bis(5'-nucleosyl)-tetraphosphatase [Gammaproteobacteria bacterium]
MSTYAIGDIQGCYAELLALLDKINFDTEKDHLWFTGDLANRGPHSLEVLRFIKQLGNQAITVLGNHDLHLLAVAFDQSRHKRPKDTLDSVLEAPDREDLLNWLRNLPLLHHDNDFGITLIHAGLPPQWDLKQASELAREVEHVLKGKDYSALIKHMYGDTPDKWSDDIAGWERLRFIINCFARLRFCDDQGRLALKENGPPGSQPEPYHPWFSLPSRKTKNEKIIFGHWSTVHIGNVSNFSEFNVYPLDTGCVWGYTLTALRLEDKKWFKVPSTQEKIHE